MLQTNPSIMTRSHHGFVVPSKLPGGGDLSLRRHQLGVFSADGTTTAAVPEHIDPYATTYARTHRLTFSPGYAEMQNRQADAPSGATHNNVATSVVPKDNSNAVESPSTVRVGAARRFPAVDPTVPRTAGSLPAELEDPMGNPAAPYPFASEYKSTFASPESRVLSRAALEPPIFARHHKTSTHAVAPPFFSDAATQEEHIPFEGSGYTTNNSFAFDPARRGREPARSHYKQTFLGVDESANVVPNFTADPVLPPSWRYSNGYLRNGDILPSVHASNIGGEPWQPTEFESHARSVERAAFEAPRPDRIPTRTIPRAASAAGATDQTRRRRIEQSAFTRSERGPPTDGVGSEHMKLRLGGGPDGQTASHLHHLSTRPHTAGYEAAPSRYHSAHTSRVAPIATRVGSGLEEAQEVAHLRKLRTSAPADYLHELAHAPRYMSTYTLMHTDKSREEVDANGGLGGLGASGEGEWGPRGLRTGFATIQGVDEPSVENGGVRHAYQTAYMRATEDATRAAAVIRAQGKDVARPTDNGYTTNARARDLLPHASNTVRHPADRFRLTSHTMHTHPDKHAAALPPASGSQINAAAPAQSSYAREHKECDTFPAERYHAVGTLDGRTVQLKARDSDLHPTVYKALKVKEAAPSGNWGGASHPLALEAQL